ncbi:MAG: ion channel [Bacteroidetes bacterium]|nr:ion channel [Bacteroidota bacterium]
MKRKFRPSLKIWNILLLVALVFAAFILPVLPLALHRKLFSIVYTFIYISAVLSLDKRPTSLLVLVAVTIIVEWVSGILGFNMILIFAKAVNVFFFIVIVFFLLKQIATARVVNAEIILGSIIGYLLLGIIYSIFLTVIMEKDPAAFNIVQPGIPAPDDQFNVSTPLYFGYVTLATVGYGDIVPLKPYTRSFATWIAISGQFYIAIIVALLVGKFAAQRKSE